jgi:hypothetical protein
MEVDYMTTITINSTSFNMYSYYLTNIGVALRLENTTFGAVETAAGNSATVQVGEEYVGYNLKLVKASKSEGKVNVEFVNEDMIDRIGVVESGLSTVRGTVSQNTGDIEANAEAIVELAEIIGGAE